MNGLSYLAGASVERNINEAIRVQEDRARLIEMQDLQARVQQRIDEKNAEIEALHQHVALRDRMIAERDELIRQRDARIRQLQEEIAQRDRTASEEFANHRSESGALAQVQEQLNREIGQLMRSGGLDEIIAAAMRQRGLTVEPELLEHIRRKIDVHLGFSNNTRLQERFYEVIYEEMNRRLRASKFNAFEFFDYAAETARRMAAEEAERKRATTEQNGAGWGEKLKARLAEGRHRNR